ncbi:MAG: SDR family oxidoreductase, partial [Bdellovibrionales bacterium]|nr:SDR family oxidoreductase [Bdellovibrionales bacterium]
MNVFVTGASGFVGGHLCRYINECGHNIFVSKSDILHTESLLAELKSNEWDACIHLAAISSYLQCQENPSLAFQVNLAGTAHLLELIGRLGKEVHFIFASTAQVYRAKDNAAHLVFKEDSLVGPQTVYGKSKLYSEEVIRKA